MRCADFKRKIGEYESGSLSSALHKQFEEHLTVCARCRQTLEDYRFSMAKLSRLCEVSAAPDIKQQVMSRITPGKLADRPLYSPAHKRFWGWAYFLGGAAVTAALLLGIMLPELHKRDAALDLAVRIALASPEVTSAFGQINMDKVVVEKVTHMNGQTVVELRLNDAVLVLADVDMNLEQVVRWVVVDSPLRFRPVSDNVFGGAT